MTVSLIPMPTERVAEWVAASRADYVRELVANGSSLTAATANADSAYSQSFADGVPAAGHGVYDVVADGATVGYIWIGPHSADGPTGWWVWDVAIDEKHRGKGYATAAMRLIEPIAKEQGAAAIGLNVFGDNLTARGLYEKLGYETKALRMAKPTRLSGTRRAPRSARRSRLEG